MYLKVRQHIKNKLAEFVNDYPPSSFLEKKVSGKENGGALQFCIVDIVYQMLLLCDTMKM